MGTTIGAERFFANFPQKPLKQFDMQAQIPLRMPDGEVIVPGSAVNERPVEISPDVYQQKVNYPIPTGNGKVRVITGTKRTRFVQVLVGGDFGWKDADFYTKVDEESALRQSDRMVVPVSAGAIVYPEHGALKEKIGERTKRYRRGDSGRDLAPRFMQLAVGGRFIRKGDMYRKQDGKTAICERDGSVHVIAPWAVAREPEGETWLASLVRAEARGLPAKADQPSPAAKRYKTRAAVPTFASLVVGARFVYKRHWYSKTSDTMAHRSDGIPTPFSKWQKTPELLT
jgi:hypothetical protein